MKAIYDEIGCGYAARRCTDPRLAANVFAALSGATRVLNIGAGSGSYEPANVDLFALEPSTTMIAQRPVDAAPVVRGFAEHLPFASNSFSHCMTILSIHHWGDRDRAFEEMNRVATDRVVALTWDPTAEAFWLTRDYFPEIHAMDVETFPDVDEFAAYFDDVSMRPLLIPADCQDGFLAAYWRRPDAYLLPTVRQSISSFSKLSHIETGLQRLADDLATGVWAERNAQILQSASLDAGYRVVSGRIRSPGGH